MGKTEYRVYRVRKYATKDKEVKGGTIRSGRMTFEWRVDKRVQLPNVYIPTWEQKGTFKSRSAAVNWVARQTLENNTIFLTYTSWPSANSFERS